MVGTQCLARQLVVAVEHLHRVVSHDAEAVDEFLQLTTLRVRVQLVAVDLHFFFWFSIYLFTTSRDTVPTDDMKLLLVQRDGNLVFNDLNSRLSE